MVCGFVQQIAFARFNFTNRPIIATDIIFCGELPVCICGVGVDELLALVKPVNRTGKRSVALRRACFLVALGDGDIPLFQNVGKALVCNLVPFDRRRLIFGDDIAYGSIDFLQRVACADQHITEICLARTVGYGVFVHRKPRKRGAGQVKFHTLIQTVLRGFGNGEIAALQNIAEIHGSNLTADNGNTANLLRFVFVVVLFGHGVNAGGEIVNLNRAACACLNGFVHAVTCNGKGNPLNLAVLGSFNDFC